MTWRLMKKILVDLLNEVEKINDSAQLTIFEALTCAYLKYCEQYSDNISIIESWFISSI